MSVTLDCTKDEGWKTLCNMRHQAKLLGHNFVVHTGPAPDKRSLSQNDLIAALYTELAKQIEDQAFNDIRAECKLRYGIPILRRDSEKFRTMYDPIRLTLSYEDKLGAMEFLPVTSLMDKKQCTEYIDTVIREYSKQGYSIIFPGEAA